MEEEKKESSGELPGEVIKIPDQDQKVLKVDLEAEKAKEILEQNNAGKLREQIEKSLEGKVIKPAEELPVPAQDDYEEKPAYKKSESVLKRMGIWTGEALSWMVGLLENRIKKFDVETSGLDNLKELEGKPYILAANHIKPRNIFMQAIGLSPDSFIIRRVVQEETQRVPNAISNVSGKIRKIPVIGYLDKIWSPFREGMMEGAGFIPVKMRRGGEQSGFNRNFVEKFREAVDRKEPVIIFSQGRWDKEFNPEREFETGTATLSSRYDLPIVPVCIGGGRSWFSKEKVSVSMGQIIDPTGKNKEDITSEIKRGITDLQRANE